MNADIELREATPDDYDGVVDFTRETWADREANDYIPDIYYDWIEGDPERKRTLVADAGEDIAGICQCVLLSGHEAWAQGMRVNPDYRGEGIGVRLNDALFRWARDQGVTVGRNMVFSWNVAGLGVSRAAGYGPATEFRWAQPEPDSQEPDDHDVISDPDAAWSFWQRSSARRDLADLTLSLDEMWAVAELTRETLHRAADETDVFAVQRPGEGTLAMGYRARDIERENDGGTERIAEYGVGAWADLDAARALFRAIGVDAAELGADRTRVLIPETVGAVSDTAALRVGVSDEPDFVLEADLTGLDG